MRGEDYKADLLEDLQDKQYAAEYLSAAARDSKESFLVALRDVTQAHGGFSEVAVEADVNRENLYRSLSKKGNPRFKVLTSVLDALGFQMVVEPKQALAVVSPPSGATYGGKSVAEAAVKVADGQSLLGSIQISESATPIVVIETASSSATKLVVAINSFPADCKFEDTPLILPGFFNEYEVGGQHA